MSAERAGHTLRPTLWTLIFCDVEAASGLVLLVAAALALVWANSPWANLYESLWHLKVASGVARWLPRHDLHFWVNDSLMTVFFLVVGLEIRREIHDGALSNPRVAILPIIAAAGGVLLPALIYIAVNAGGPGQRGWAIPTATDIAFAVGVLSLVGRGAPPALRMLLLTLAIIDDIAAILVIALFYSSGIATAGLAIVALGILIVLALQWLSVQSALAYVLPGAIVWFGMLRAGVHPALAGVLLGLLTPATAAFGRGRRVRERPALDAPVVRVEAMLHPYVAFGIMPLFALANAGVSLEGVSLTHGGGPLTVTAGVVLGLVLGKPLGVILASFAAVRLKLCVLPDEIRWRHVLLLGCLAGIGFTMSIFMAQLAFEDDSLLSAAKLAVLVASGLAAVLGFIVGRVP
ncbi:MAG: Na+/H+ antiporter NhaA [Steroidobacteraceae bacterium]